MTAASDRGAIDLAERLLTLLEEGGFAATYKYAVLLAIMDVCMERTSANGLAPDTITTRQLAERVTELYWPHSLPYITRGHDKVLLQNTARNAQAVVISRITKFRELYAPDPGVPISRARSATGNRFETLLRFVEWKLIEMPLPRLQHIGHHEDRFLYKINWDRSIKPRLVKAYQRGDNDEFDNRIMLRPSVGEHLVSLHGLLRPIIHRRWAAMVARINRLEEARLESFLFGEERISMEPVRNLLKEIQRGRCFFCHKDIRGAAEVDHFIPWARYPDNGLDNLVLTHALCNQAKRHYLACEDHVERWVDRFSDREYNEIIASGARSLSWDRNIERTLGIGRAIYLRLPAHANLWISGKDFSGADPERLQSVLR